MTHPSFELTGGALCLDFANTVGDRPHRIQEHLHSYTDLLEWARQSGAVAAPEAAALARAARARPERAGRALTRALTLRESVYAVFHALAAGEAAPAADLARLNAALQEARARQELAPEPDGSYRWRFTGDPAQLERPLWPVADSAAALLVSEERARVRECGSDRCSWLFLDRSRARRRRWCDMRTCGNRAKARRHYQRQRQASRGAGDEG